MKIQIDYRLRSSLNRTVLRLTGANVQINSIYSTQLGLFFFFDIGFCSHFPEFPDLNSKRIRTGLPSGDILEIISLSTFSPLANIKPDADEYVINALSHR